MITIWYAYRSFGLISHLLDILKVTSFIRCIMSNPNKGFPWKFSYFCIWGVGVIKMKPGFSNYLKIELPSDYYFRKMNTSLINFWEHGRHWLQRSNGWDGNDKSINFIQLVRVLLLTALTHPLSGLGGSELPKYLANGFTAQTKHLCSFHH